MPQSRLLSFCLLILTLGHTSQAALQLILDPTIERDFLMDGDRVSPARDGVAVRMRTYVYTNTTDTSELASYRYEWTLEVFEFGVWTAVPLAGGGTTQTSDSVVVYLTNASGDDQPSFQWVDITDSLDPQDTLDPEKLYRVRGQLQRLPFLSNNWADLSTSRTSTGQQIYHFTNTGSSDNARNVISELESVNLANPFLLDDATDTSKRGFTVETDATIRRWDAYSAGPIFGFMTFRYEIELRDAATDALIPLVQSTFTETGYYLTYNNSGADPIPSETTVPRSFTVVPATQLDPTGDNYYVRVTITHVEETSPSEVVRIGNSLDTPDSQFFHFNGSLAFTGNNTVLSDFVRSPQPATSNGAGYVAMTLSGVDGHLAAGTGYSFSAPAGVSLRLFSDGTAAVTSLGASIAVNQPANDIGSAADVRFLRQNLNLNAGGLSGNLNVYLPQGMGYRLAGTAERIHSGELQFGSIALTDALGPNAADLTYVAGAGITVSEETKPLQLSAATITWSVASGEFAVSGAGGGQYVRAEENDFLKSAPVPLEEKEKFDNTGYYEGFDSTTAASFRIDTDANAAASMTVNLLFVGGDYYTHFPRGTQVAFGAGQMAIENDVIASGKLTGVQKLTVGYERACVDRDGAELEGCSSNSDEGFFTIDVGELEFTPDGGLTGQGALENNAVADTDLRWGKIDSIGEYAHTLSSFSDGVFHMTGHFLLGTGGSSPDFLEGASARVFSDAGPARTLLAAVKGGTDLARPGSAGDASGTYNYAGVNLEVGADGADGAVIDQAYIAGQLVPYSVRGCNRFYARRGGVTGTLEADPGSFPAELVLYNYNFKFDYYGLAFLQNTTSPELSFTSGSVSVPAPAKEIFEFDGLSFTCPGGLAEARLPDGGLDKQLQYWAADFDVSTLSFTSSDGCDPTANAYLTLGATVYSTLLDTPLSGIVGIDPDGELIDKDFSDAEALERTITSRFRLPNRFELKGPGEEVYAMTAISEAYFNDFASTSEQSTGEGRLNFAATADVPFFEDLEVHVRTTASQTFNPDATVDLMGGWTEAGQTYFSADFFDSGNRAWPADDGVSEALYRNEPGASGNPEPYLIHARQDWLEVVTFDYLLDWSSSLRSFTTYSPVQDYNLVVVTVDHQLDYLSAENAEISFGAVYEGLPKINLANFTFNKIDEGTGALQAMVQTFRQELASKGEAAVGALEDGVNGIDDMLQDQLDAMLENFYSQTIDPIVGALYNGLDQLDHETATVNDWITQVEDETNRMIVSYVPQGYDPVGSLTSVRDAIKALDDTAADASSFINKVDESLEQVQIAVRLIHGRVYYAAGSSVALEVPGSPNTDYIIQGLLYQDNGEFEIASTLVSALLAELGSEIGSELAGLLGDVLEAPVGELNDLINEQLDAVKPTLEQLTTVLEEIDTQIGNARAEIASAGEFVQEIEAILDAADALIDTATLDLETQIQEVVFERIPQPSQFVEYTEEEVKALIRQEIEDKIRELDIIPEFQLVLRQHFYDLDLQIKEGIDTAFAQMNQAIKALLKDYLAEFDDKINGFLGELGSSLGAGEIEGFAHINGDSLRLLRLDAYLQMKVPDDFEFNGYLQIKQLTSDGSDACSYSSSGTAKEVTMGALGVPVGWISDGMEVDVEGKVVFTTVPVGLGGKVEMVEGEFGFESFTVTDLGAAMSFGVAENYIAAEVGLQFQSYAMYGGVFFGQTCDIAPLAMVNDQAASVLGNPNPTFTGAYVYGEAHIPVSEAILGIPASCMFKITAGVGAGAFYFVEGPTFGGQMLLAVSGEALCLVGIKGDVSLVGAKVADELRFSGRGRLSGKVGACPFCVKFGKSFTMEYKNDRWSYDL